MVVTVSLKHLDVKTSLPPHTAGEFDLGRDELTRPAIGPLALSL